MTLPETSGTLPATGGLRDWTQVRAGDVVKGKDGAPWTVMARDTAYDPAEVVLERADGKRQFTGHPAGPVTVLSSAAEELELAVATVQVRIGGVVYAETDDQGRQVAPVTFGHYGALAAHIYILHGRTVDVPEADQRLGDLIGTHDRLHLPENRTAASGYIEHVHDPEFYKRRNQS